ncbi:MAG TPA: response regulator transcription factor [Chitinophagaceae bacterium]
MSKIATPIYIVFADDHPIFRNGFRSSLQHQTDIQLLAEACNGKDLFDLVDKHLPSVVITDIAMPVMNGIEVIKHLKMKYPHIGVIALSMHEDLTTIKEIIQAGAKGYLSKIADVEEIILAIKTVFDGRFYSSAAIVSCLMEALQKKVPEQCNFTNREIEIIQLLYQERTSHEIASELFISEETVKDHRKHIQKKVGAKSVVGIIKHALKNHLVKLN